RLASLTVVDHKARHTVDRKPQQFQTLRAADAARVPMRRHVHWAQTNLGERAILPNFQHRPQMPEVHRVEGTTEDPDRRSRRHAAALPLLTDLAISQDNELLRGQPFQADRAARVQLVGADTDLGTKTVLETVGKAG